MAKVAILGCGYVGNALGDNLIKAGHQVWGVRRSQPIESPSFEVVLGDVCDSPVLASLPEDLDWAYYMVSAGASSEEAYRLAYVDGLRAAISQLQQMKNLNRLVFVSSTGVYGENNGSWVDETTDPGPKSATGKILYEGEQLAQSSNIATTIVRFGGIYGPGRDRLIRLVAGGLAESVKGFPIYTNRIHRDDCAGLLQFIQELDEPESLYVGVDDCPCDRGEVLAWMAEQFGVEKLAEVEWSEEKKKERGQGKRCSNARVKAAGYEFLYPSFREGYRDAISSI